MTNTRPLVLVLGASGTVGRFLLPRLVSGGACVLAISRAPPRQTHPDVLWVQHDMREGAMVTDAAALISVGPLKHAIEQVMGCPHLGRVVAMSSASLLFKAASDDASERALIADLRDTEATLGKVCAERGITLTVLRPCMIYGGHDHNVSVVDALIRRLPLIPVGGRGLRQPVHADDLAAVCVTALERGASGGGVFELAGGETIDYLQMIRRIASMSGKQARVIRLPVPALALAVRLLRLAGLISGVTPAMIKRQRQDLIVDDQRARARLDWSPRPFRPAGD